MIGPKSKLPRLEQQVDRDFTWFVSPANGTDDEVFKTVDVALRRATLRKIQADLASGRINVAWYLNKDIEEDYRNLLRNFHYILKTVPDTFVVVNISVGPSMKLVPLDCEDPVHRVFDDVSKKGLLVVASHGNEGRTDGSRDGIISPWASPEWAIGVGACSHDGTEMYPRSSRGAPDCPETWPDLVAPCTSERDPSRKGTSYAAPRVAAAVFQIVHFMIAFADHAGPENSLKLRIPEETLAAGAALGPRLVGRRLPWNENGMPVLEFDPVPSRELVKQLLRDFTRPLPNMPPHIAGAGVLDSARLYADLGVFGRPTPKIMALKQYDDAVS